MLEYLRNLPSAVYNHYHALTGIVLVVAILKIVFPPCFYVFKEIANRNMERKSALRFIKSGMAEDKAWQLAKSIWRPENEQPFLIRILKKIFKRK